MLFVFLFPSRALNVLVYGHLTNMTPARIGLSVIRIDSASWPQVEQMVRSRDVANDAHHLPLDGNCIEYESQSSPTVQSIGSTTGEFPGRLDITDAFETRFYFVVRSDRLLANLESNAVSHRLFSGVPVTKGQPNGRIELYGSGHWHSCEFHTEHPLRSQLGSLHHR